MRWRREWPGHYQAIGRRFAYAIDQRGDGWSIIERPVVVVAGLHLGDPRTTTAHVHGVESLDLARAVVALADGALPLAGALAAARAQV